MSEDTELESFDRLVRELWKQQGYDVVPGDEADLVAYREGETRLLDTYPEGRVTAADVDEAVSQLIGSTKANHVTMVVAGAVPPELREQTEEWAVSIVGEDGLRDLSESQNVAAFLDDESAGPSGQTQAESPVSDSPATLEVETPTDPDAEAATDRPSPSETSPSEESSSETDPDPAFETAEGASDTQVESTVQRRERRTLVREFGALALEALLVLGLVVALGYLVVQVAALA